MMNKCGCFHHKFAMIVGGLGMLCGLAFFWGAIAGTLVFGYNAGFYFEATIVLALMAHGTKMCKCCCGGWKCGSGDCGACVADGKDGGMCKHNMDCKCGDCGRCK